MIGIEQIAPVFQLHLPLFEQGNTRAVLFQTRRILTPFEQARRPDQSQRTNRQKHDQRTGVDQPFAYDAKVRGLPIHAALNHMGGSDSRGNIRLLDHSCQSGPHLRQRVHATASPLRQYRTRAMIAR
jgi:hypothetical protein